MGDQPGLLQGARTLTPGLNNLVFSWDISGSNERGQEQVNVTYDRPTTVPPLHLAIVAACDSPVWQNDGRKPPSVPRRPDHGTAGKSDKMSRFLNKAMDRLDIGSGGEVLDDKDRALVDAPPGPRREALRAGGIAEVKRRVALQAYLWQAFHAEQMRRHGMGRRAFQLDDAASDSSFGSAVPSQRLLELLPRIHLLKSRRTLQEFRDPHNAQQMTNARNGGAMHSFAAEALEDPPLHASFSGRLWLC